MTSQKEEKARRRTLMRESLRTLAHEEMPGLELEGAYLLVSKKLTVWNPTGATVLLVDTHRGKCLRFEYVDAFLNNKIGQWLDAAFGNALAPAELYFDGDKTVHQGALVAWGAARGISVAIHPACLEADAFSALIPSLVEAINQAMLDETSELRIQRFERWRIEYNSRLETPDFRA